MSDTENHCIRVIDKKIERVATIAGKCGEIGFKDGFSLTSRLNKPKNMGFDRRGNIYIYDSGNNYIRLLEIPKIYSDLNDFVMKVKLKTLMHGSCFDLPKDYKDDYSISLDWNHFKYSLCYPKWLKNKKSDLQYFNFEIIENYCSKKYNLCPKV